MRIAYFLPVGLLFIGLLIACNDGKKYHDAKDGTVALEEKVEARSMSAYDDAVLFQKELNEEYADPKRSPLTKKDLKNFKSLAFFPVDTTYRVVAKFQRTPNEQPFLMPTTTDRKSEEVVYGIASFQLHGKVFELNVYQNQQLKETEEYRDYLFLPFADITNGEETYGGGRYIDLRIPEADSLVIDFNKAYNPYCAYNKKYSCPLVPKENTLDYAIRAGVKKFK